MNCNNCTNNNALKEVKIKHVQGNVLRMAIPLTLRTIELVDGEINATDTPFVPSSEHPVKVVFSKKGSVSVALDATMKDGNIAYIEEKGKIPVGTYAITVTCNDDNGNPYRFKQNAVLYVADATIEAGIEETIEYEVTTWYLDAAIFLALKGEDGVGIYDIDTQSSGEIGGVNTVTFILTDGRTRSFDILNGSGAVDSDLDINSPSPIANSAVTAKFNELSGELADLFGDVDYDTSSKSIRFWDKGKTNVLASLDARPFIKDGMVSNAYISNNTLVITFNTDSGKEAIGVPLTSVFNPNNYYTKTQVDSRIASAVANINLTNYYTKSQTDTMVSRITPYEVTFTTGNNSNIVCDHTIANIYQNYQNHKPIIGKFGKSVGTLVYIKGGEDPEAAFLFGDRYDSPYLLRYGISGWGKDDLVDDSSSIEIDGGPIEDSENAVSSGGVWYALTQKVSSVTINGTTQTPDEDGDVSFTVEGGSGGYEPPVGGIPKTDLASGVQSSLDAADSAYQKPSGGIPSTDMTSAVQTSLGKADTAYQKPSGGIPASDLASGVIPDVSGFVTSSDVQTAIAGLVDSAPETLDTLNELAAALGDDKDFATTMSTALGNKVDKETGKGLSTNDYTTAEKTKLAGLENYDDSTLQTSIDGKVDKENGKSLMTDAEHTKLAGIAAGAEVNVQPNWTQTNTSADDYIKNKPTLATVATSGSYNDLQDKPTIPTVPTNVSAFTNDAGYTTNAGTITGITMNGASKGTSGVVDLGTVITAHQDISGKANSADLATVATSGSYNDLSNKPTIPAAQVNSDWNASTGKAAILNKPTIPVGIANATTSEDGTWTMTLSNGEYITIDLNHEHPQYQPLLAAGTNITIAEVSGVLTISASGGNSNAITGITMNGNVVTVNNGVASLGTVITSHQSLSGYAKYVLLADEAAYTALATKDSSTLYLIPES